MAPEGTAQLAIVPAGDPELEPIAIICAGAVERRNDGNDRFILMEGLRFKAKGVDHQQDALLCLNQRDGYPTKLYLTQQVPGVHQNWQGPYYILGRPWRSWSWNNVSADQTPIKILASHLQALQ